jgi:glycosyltransferase involved in cell wall biosynthesis
MLNTADICVNPDRANAMNDRSTMNKIMEYMALGKPVVQFELTEGRVSAGDASWYARPNDVADLAQKMVALLADEQQRIHMGAIGRDRVERLLSWQHEAPRLLAAYDNLLGERS